MPPCSLALLPGAKPDPSAAHVLTWAGFLVPGGRVSLLAAAASGCPVLGQPVAAERCSPSCRPAAPAAALELSPALGGGRGALDHPAEGG